MAAALRNAGASPGERAVHQRPRHLHRPGRPGRNHRGQARLRRSRAKKLVVNSAKSMTGHLLGAAGGIEAVFSAPWRCATRSSPPTIQYLQPGDPGQCDLDYCANTARDLKVDVGACPNSFGFGGTNSTLVFKPGLSRGRLPPAQKRPDALSPASAEPARGEMRLMHTASALRPFSVRLTRLEMGWAGRHHLRRGAMAAQLRPARTHGRLPWAVLCGACPGRAPCAGARRKDCCALRREGWCEWMRTTRGGLAPRGKMTVAGHVQAASAGWFCACPNAIRPARRGMRAVLGTDPGTPPVVTAPGTAPACGSWLSAGPRRGVDLNSRRAGMTGRNFAAKHCAIRGGRGSLQDFAKAQRAEIGTDRRGRHR